MEVTRDPGTTTPAQGVRLNVLGPLRAWRDGRAVELGPPKQRAVLAVLASRANETVGFEQIVDGVWGNTMPHSAANGVHTYIAGLRRALEPGRGHRDTGQVLVSTGGGYSLQVDPDALDLEIFLRRYAQARRESAAGDLDQSIDLLESAMALWRGQAYANVPGPFAELERTRLEELRLAATEEWAETRLLVGRHTDLVATLYAACAREPLRERLRWLHMVALCRANRQAHALAVYRDTRRLLNDELGIEPGHDLRQLHQQILAGDPALSRWAQPGAAAPRGHQVSARAS